MTKTYGVQCAGCDGFIPLNQYEGETRPDVHLNHLPIDCPHCRQSIVYANSEVIDEPDQPTARAS